MNIPVWDFQNENEAQMATLRQFVVRFADISNFKLIFGPLFEFKKSSTIGGTY